MSRGKGKKSSGQSQSRKPAPAHTVRNNSLKTVLEGPEGSSSRTPPTAVETTSTGQQQTMKTTPVASTVLTMEFLSACFQSPNSPYVPNSSSFPPLKKARPRTPPRPARPTQTSAEEGYVGDLSGAEEVLATMAKGTGRGVEALLDVMEREQKAKARPPGIDDVLNMMDFDDSDDSDDEEGYGGLTYLRKSDLPPSSRAVSPPIYCGMSQEDSGDDGYDSSGGEAAPPSPGADTLVTPSTAATVPVPTPSSQTFNSLLFEHRSPKSLADESRLAIITANIMLSNEKEGLSFQQLLHEQHLASSTAAVTTPSSFSTSPSEKTTLSENEPLKLGLTYLQPGLQPGGQPGVHQKANLKLTSPHHRGPPGGGGVHHQSSFAACVKVDSPHRDVHANSPRPKLRGGSRRSGNSSSCVGCSYISSLHRLL